MFPVSKWYSTSPFIHHLPQKPANLSQQEYELGLTKTHEIFSVLKPVTNRKFVQACVPEINKEINLVYDTACNLIKLPSKELLNIHKLSLFLFKTYSIENLTDRSTIVNALVKIADPDRRMFIKKILKLLKISPDYNISPKIVLTAISRLNDLPSPETFENLRTEYKKYFPKLY